MSLPNGPDVGPEVVSEYLGRLKTIDRSLKVEAPQSFVSTLEETRETMENAWVIAREAVQQITGTADQVAPDRLPTTLKQLARYNLAVANNLQDMLLRIKAEVDHEWGSGGDDTAAAAEVARGAVEARPPHLVNQGDFDPQEVVDAWNAGDPERARLLLAEHPNHVAAKLALTKTRLDDLVEEYTRVNRERIELRAELHRRDEDALRQRVVDEVDCALDVTSMDDDCPIHAPELDFTVSFDEPDELTGPDWLKP